MAHNPGSMKRQKELARLEWQREKAAKRKARKEAKKNAPAGGAEEDQVVMPPANPESVPSPAE